MSTNSFLGNPNLKFWVVGPPITESEINSVIPNSFAGKEEFIRFYLRHNGGCFEGWAVFYRDKFYSVPRGYHNSMEIASFYFIPRYGGEKASSLRSLVRVRELRAQYCPQLKTFIETSLPFAGDADDNDYWIDTQTGSVKYIVWEAFQEGVVDIAPSFNDFVSNFLSERRRPAP